MSHIETQGAILHIFFVLVGEGRGGSHLPLGGWQRVFPGMMESLERVPGLLLYIFLYLLLVLIPKWDWGVICSVKCKEIGIYYFNVVCVCIWLFELWHKICDFWITFLLYAIRYRHKVVRGQTPSSLMFWLWLLP